MILTKHILNQISWWEAGTGGSLRKSNWIKIHFKQWWKPSQKFKFEVRVTEYSDDGWSYSYVSSQEYRILYDQLVKYFAAELN